MTDRTDMSWQTSCRILKLTAFALVGLILLPMLFYGVEDLRGWCAWQSYKSESAARGVKLDWAAYVPPPVPDKDNFFKVPDMEAWFVGRGNTPFSTRIAFEHFSKSARDSKNRSLARVTIVPANAEVKPGDADIVLQYDYPTLTLAGEPTVRPATFVQPDAIPLIVMDEVPLHAAIKNLAQQVHIRYVTEESVLPLDDSISLRWENVSATNALIAILHNHGLELHVDAHTDFRRIGKAIDYGPATNTATAFPGSMSRETIPLIVMDEVPLRDAIKNLARQAGLNYLVDPSVEPLNAPISFRWQKVSAMSALVSVLQQHNLVCYADAQTGIARITKASAVKSLVNVEPSLHTKLGDLLANAVDATTNGQAQTHLSGATGIELCTAPLRGIKPARIIVRTDWTPDEREIKEFFPTHPLNNNAHSTMPSIVSVNAVREGNDFNIVLDKPGLVNAADYLAWSDQFADDFAKIDAALQRPYARMDGDYSDPLVPPTPNLISVRLLVQMLSQRAQCYLLLNQPTKALRELTMLHHASRLINGRSTGRPVTFIDAMMNAAVTGLYVSTVADGFRLHAWHETELATFQQQLAEINLTPCMRDALESDTIAHSRVAETKSPGDLARIAANYARSYNEKFDFAEKIKDPTYIFLTFAPHGWVYQNFTRAGRLEQGLLPAFDVANRVVFPRIVEQQTREMNTVFRHLSAYTYYGAQTAIDFTRAVETAAKSQTLANEACIICALERHRLAHGSYPASLDALAAEFSMHFQNDLFGGEPLKYRAEGGRFVLYSVGWNEQDDGGKPCWDKNRDDLAHDDWVWTD